MLSYAEPEERDRIAELRRRTAAAASTEDDDLERVKALRLKAAASTPADDEDLQRVAALRRRTAAAPAWTPADEEELAALRRKAQQELPTTVTPDGSFNTSDEDAPHTCREDFVIEKSIGKGAFGEVFLATSKQNGRSYAIKTIPRGKAGDERRALMSVRHPFVVRLRYWFDGPADTWLVMDYAPRGTLASHLERRSGRRLPIAHARLVSAELASALLALHAAGVVHRDVKPSNILVDSDGHCLLADLGLAATRASMRLCGTLEYLAPEQLRGKTYGRSVDLWALVSDPRTMSPTEAWAWIDDLATREGPGAVCAGATATTLPAATRDRSRVALPVFLHFCQRYEASGYFFAKRRLDHDFFGCGSEPLRFDADAIIGGLGGSPSTTAVRTAFMLCHIIPMMNSFLASYKRDAC